MEFSNGEKIRLGVAICVLLLLLYYSFGYEEEIINEPFTSSEQLSSEQFNNEINNRTNVRENNQVNTQANNQAAGDIKNKIKSEQIYQIKGERPNMEKPNSPKNPFTNLTQKQEEQAR